jgi:hypothetical protein
MRTHCGAAGILTLFVYHTLRYKTHHKETIAKFADYHRQSSRINWCILNSKRVNIGRLEKFLSPSPDESDSMSARGHERMERVMGQKGFFDG